MGKDLEGSGCGFIKVLTQHLSVVTENTKNKDVTAEIRTENFPMRV
jgi:hypothetical protein